MQVKNPVPTSSPMPTGAPSTAGATGSPSIPTSIRQNLDSTFHGDPSQISTNTNARALQARADYGLTDQGARSYVRGQDPAFLIDQTKMGQHGLIAHEAAHVVQQ